MSELQYKLAFGYFENIEDLIEHHKEGGKQLVGVREGDFNEPAVVAWVAFAMILEYHQLGADTFTEDLFFQSPKECRDKDYTWGKDGYYPEPLYHAIKYLRFSPNVGGFECSTNTEFLKVFINWGLIEVVE